MKTASSTWHSWWNVALVVAYAYPWPVHITKWSSSLIFPHDFWPAHNAQSALDEAHPASTVACTFLNLHCSWTAHIECGLCLLLRISRAWTNRITLCLQTTISDIGCFLHRSPLASIIVRQYRVWPSCITFGVHKIESLRQIWTFGIAFVLKTIVSRHRNSTARIMICMHTIVGRC